MFATLFLIVQTASAETEPSDIKIIKLNATSQIFNTTYIESLPKTTVSAALYCYGTIVSGGDWAGVELTTLLTTAGIDTSTINSVQLSASDGYSVQLDNQTLMRSDVIVAYERDSNPLPENYRLVVPGANGEIWIAMITEIKASETVVDRTQTLVQITPPLLQSHGGSTTQISPSEPTQIPTSQVTPTPTVTPTPKPTPSPAPTTNPTVNATVSTERSAFPIEIPIVAAVIVAALLTVVGLMVIRRHKTEP